MFEALTKFFKKFSKENKESAKDSKDTAKERLHLVLMQDRANVSADFLELMKQEIIDVIKKYIDVDENQIDVKLTNKLNSDGTTGAPALYANIPIVSIKDETRKITVNQEETVQNKEENPVQKEEEKDEEEQKEEKQEEQPKETVETKIEEETQQEPEIEEKKEEVKEAKEEKPEQAIQK